MAERPLFKYGRDMDQLTLVQSFLLFLCLGLALVFEFANGFHDTANAVATVIYTRSMRPYPAVFFSALFNFIGVWAGGTAVAMSIVSLLPAELLIALGSNVGLAMVFAILFTAIFWNLTTWWLGIPASSSHTLIGSILGVGMANSLLPGHAFGFGVNWGKAGEVLLSLLVSPLLGVSIAFVALHSLSRAVGKSRRWFQPLGSKETPPKGIRALLITTCGGVSLAHGSNDGQKGVGLILLILVGLLPAQYSMRPDLSAAQWDAAQQAVQTLWAQATRLPTQERAAAQLQIAPLQSFFALHPTHQTLSATDRQTLRKEIILFTPQAKSWSLYRPETQRSALKKQLQPLRSLVEFVPTWVVGLVALALSLGTLVGWKRIVVTIGEKIGKSHLSPAQGAVAESVAMSMIGVSSLAGLPVSTTHVLSSAIAGTMLANRSGIQSQTVRKILIAWLLTLPVTVLLSGALYLGLRAIL